MATFPMEKLGRDDYWHSLAIQIIHHQVNIVSIASLHWLDFLLGYPSELWRRRVSISCDTPVVMSVCVSVFRGWNVMYGSTPTVFFRFGPEDHFHSSQYPHYLRAVGPVLFGDCI